MTTIQLYPNFYKITGKLDIKNITKTSTVLFDYIKQYKKNKINAIILDNTFIDYNKIKLNGYQKKNITFTIYSKNNDIIDKIDTLLKKLDNKNLELQKIICYHIELYKVMGIKNYKRTLKYLFISNCSMYFNDKYKTDDYKKKFDLTYNFLKKNNKFIILDDIIKECKNNMK